MDFPLASHPQTIRVRLSGVIRGMVQMVLGRERSGAMPDWMVTAIRLRVVRIGMVISTLLLAMQAGTLVTRRSPAPGGTRKPAVRKAAPTMRLPGDFGWLVKRLAWHAVGCGSQLRHVLADPEMVALLAASPRAVRTLKPLCRMFMIEFPTPTPPAPTVPTAPIEGGDVVRQRRPRRPRPRAWTPSYNPPLARETLPGVGGGWGGRRSEKKGG